MVDEQWEVMSVNAVRLGERAWALSVVEPSDFQSIPRDADGGQGDQGMKLVQRLGEDGWELVSVFYIPHLDNATERTYWLKRRRPS